MSAQNPEGYSTEKLLKEAAECIAADNDSLTQRALKCYSLVTGRYYAHPEDTSLRKDATTAFRQMGNDYMTYSIDYKNAYKNLQMARQIAEEDGDREQLAYLYMSLGNLYSVNTTVSNAPQLLPKTIEMLTKSAEAAIASHSEEIAASLPSTC